MLAKQVLSQLSYTPTREVTLILKHFPPFRISILRKIVTRLATCLISALIVRYET